MTHSDTAAVVDRYPGSAACGIDQGVEERPVRHRVRAVEHCLGFPIRTRHRAGVQVIAPDDDRSTHLPGSDHLVERDPKTVAIIESDPADACGKSLELNPLARHVQPSEQMWVIREAP